MFDSHKSYGPRGLGYAVKLLLMGNKDTLDKGLDILKEDISQKL